MSDEIAEHQPHVAVSATGRIRKTRLCIRCVTPWPCLVRRLADDNARLRAVLAWYADEGNYSGGGPGHIVAPSMTIGRTMETIIRWVPDMGQRARDALWTDEG